MGRSFAPVTAAEVPESTAPYYHVASETYFGIFLRGPSAFHRRWQIGPDGREVNMEEQRIDYVLGSGSHARTYLHRTANGTLIELPLGWYGEKQGYFAMNPGFDTSHPETRRKIDYDCMSCHNAYPRIPKGHELPGAEPVFPSTLPAGIDCQRCHGSAAGHVVAATTPGTAREAIRASIVNPARLSAERQAEICLQCHLETTSSGLPSIIRRFDRSPFSWNPGEPLSSFQLFFDHSPGSGRDEKFEIVSSAYRMRQSQCFLKSSTLTCTTCHNPHEAQRGQAAMQRYAAACRSCHSALDAFTATGEHPPGGNCVECHMPKRRTADAVHVVMTDHLIQRRPPQGDLLAERAESHPSADAEYRGEVVPYYPSPLPASGENKLYSAVAQVLHGSNLLLGIPQLESELATQRPREAEFYVALGNAWQQMHRPDKAAGAFREAVRLRPKSAREQRYLGIALKESGQTVAAAAAFQNATRLESGDAASWYQLALIDSEQGRTVEAAAKAAKAISLDPDLLDARNSLGVNLSALGDVAGAEAAFRAALVVNPYFATAHGNLARLLAGKGELAQAQQHFSRAILHRPDFAPDRYEYALALVQSNRFEEAQTQVEAAIRLDPAMVEARTLLAGLFAKVGRLSAARHEYEQALQLRPGFGRAHLDLARVLAAQGDMPGAMEHLRLAAQGSDVSSARQAAEALEHLRQPVR